MSRGLGDVYKRQTVESKRIETKKYFSYAQRFVNRINFETKPLVRGIPANPNIKTQNDMAKNLLFFISPLILSISKLEDNFPLIIENIVKIPIS
mgnify:CR=1 FL=1